METGTMKRTSQWFGVSFTTLCATLIFLGFSFTFFSEVLSRLRPSILYLHVTTAAFWLILLVGQAVLAMRRKLALHRRIGEWGFYFGAFTAATAFANALILRHESVLQAAADRRDGRIAFLSIPLNTAIVFAALLACAYVWRHKPGVHRRCMLLGAAVLTLPAVARIPVIGDSPFTTVPTDVLILLLAATDLWRDRRLHPVHWIAIPGIIGLQQFALWLFLARPEWWIRTAAFLCAV